MGLSQKFIRLIIEKRMIIFTNQKKTNEVKRGLFFLKTIAILNEGKYIRIWKMDLGETGTYSTEGETGNTQKLSGKRTES